MKSMKFHNEEQQKTSHLPSTQSDAILQHTSTQHDLQHCGRRIRSPRDSEYNSQNIEVVDCNVSVVSVADLDWYLSRVTSKAAKWFTIEFNFATSPGK